MNCRVLSKSEFTGEIWVKCPKLPVAGKDGEFTPGSGGDHSKVSDCNSCEDCINITKASVLCKFKMEDFNGEIATTKAGRCFRCGAPLATESSKKMLVCSTYPACNYAVMITS